MTHVEAEIASQPEMWRRAAALVAQRREILPAPAVALATEPGLDPDRPRNLSRSVVRGANEPVG